MVQIVQKYTYTKLKRQTTPAGRLYQSPDGNGLPSVTTILDKTMPQKKKDILNNWRQRIGVKKAQTITTDAANRGTSMHKHLENYMLGVIVEVGSNHIHQLSLKMAQQIIANGLSHVTDCWGVEVPLYYPGLYAGTTDAVGLYKGMPAIIDFKQTNRPKTDEMVEDYKLQIAAYSLAHDELHNDSSIERGVILMCSKDFKYQEWILEKAELEDCKDKWLKRVAQYYTMFS